MFDKCEFISSALNINQSPNKGNFNEFVFLGRSNVGKSSLINALMKRKALARISSKPGKTITLNYFLIDDSLFLVDVPGYGYANRSHEKKETFGKAIEDYLINSKCLKEVFLLVDTLVGPTKDDILMYNYLMHLSLNVTIIATKCDKLGSTLRYKAIKKIKETLNNDNVIMTSSEKNIGITDIQNQIYNSL